MLFKFALRELIRHWKFSLFFVFNLAIGLAGVMTLETFKGALQDHLKQNAKQILGADLAVTARREFKTEENETLDGVSAEKSTSYDFFAMATTDSQSRLVLVKAVDSAFPLYGEFTNEKDQKIFTKNLAGGENLWIYPEVRDYFQIGVGSSLKIGNVQFKVQQVVGKDSTLTFRSASLAPRVYMPLDQLEKTGLIQFGSTFTKALLFRFPSDKEAATYKQQFFDNIKDPAVRIEGPEEGSEDSGRQLKYLSDYLGLVTLVALFLSAIGAAYLFRLFIQQKLKDIAIFRSLGLRGGQAISIFLIETVALGTTAVAIAGFFSVLVMPALTAALGSLLPIALNLSLSLHTFLVTMVIAIFGSLGISFPFILKVRGISVSQLFSEDHFQSELGKLSLLAWIPAIVLFSALAVYQAQSYKLGLGFTAGLVLGLVLISALGLVLFYLVGRLQFKVWNYRYSILSMQRRKISSLALFASLSLGTMLINVLPQLKVTLQSSMQMETGTKLPSLFMFDIQDEQYQPLKNYLQSVTVEALDYSPMVRGRILKINDQDFERKLETTEFKTREEEREARFRNRGVNITYREKLGAAEEIYDGEPFSGKIDPELAELSVERRYADRMELKIGDILTFDIQGLEIKGRIQNLRDVKWVSFRPNFFIVIQPGFLEEAPKTYISALPRLAPEMKLQLQTDLAKNFSNISIIDVDRLVMDVLKLAEQMSLSLELMAWLSLLAGYVVLYSIVRSQVVSRRWELNMIKILGARSSQLRVYLLFEVFVVAVLASALGACLSLVASGILSWFIFEIPLLVSWSWIGGSILGICLLSLAIGYVAAQKIVNEKPQVILGGD